MPTITLPLPPSVNRLWRAGRGRVYRSARYEAWRDTAGWELKLQRPGRITGPVTIVIAAGRPDRRRRDADNLPKALLDLLTLYGVIEDDSRVVRLTSGWEPRSRPAPSTSS